MYGSHDVDSTVLLYFRIADSFLMLRNIDGNFGHFTESSSRLPPDVFHVGRSLGGDVINHDDTGPDDQLDKKSEQWLSDGMNNWLAEGDQAECAAAFIDDSHSARNSASGSLGWPRRG